MLWRKPTLPLRFILSSSLPIYLHLDTVYISFLHLQDTLILCDPSLASPTVNATPCPSHSRAVYSFDAARHVFNKGRISLQQR